MIAHVENPRTCANLKKLLKQINELSKVSGYKVNIPKSTVFLHTSNEQLGFEI